MRLKASDNVELKETALDSLGRDIVAMANSHGGHIYVGVSEDGAICGIENPKEMIQKVQDQLKEIKPDLIPWIKINREKIEGKTIIELDINRGSKRPYFLAQNGMSPEGVYIRENSVSIPTTEKVIQEMIEESDGSSFEKKRSLHQQLTFSEAASFFKDSQLDFQAILQSQSEILTSDNLYSNLGLLLSDQNPFSIQLTIFNGPESDQFQAREEFKGSILKQLEDVYAFLDRNVNDIQADFQGIHRIDHRIYPEMALREALINALVHRDYSLDCAIQIRVYSNRLEIISPGGLCPGKTKEDLFNEVSLCRNKKLAELFYSLKITDSFGTGMIRIWQAYQGLNKEPDYLITPNGFKIILPKLDDLSHQSNNSFIEDDSSRSRLLSLMKKNRSYSRVQLETALNLSRATTTRLLNTLIEQGELCREGKGKNTRYRLPD